MTTFSDLDPAHRVASVDHLVAHLDEHLDGGGLADLSPATAAWLEQVKHGLIDDALDGDDFDDLDERFRRYLETLPEDEAHAANARLLRFAFVAQRMPADGTTPGDWFKANLRGVTTDETVGDWLVRLMNDDRPATVGNRAQRRGRHRRGRR